MKRISIPQRRLLTDILYNDVRFWKQPYRTQNLIVAVTGREKIYRQWELGVAYAVLKKGLAELTKDSNGKAKLVLTAAGMKAQKKDAQHWWRSKKKVKA